MSKEMIITSSPQETKVAILEDDLLTEVHIERSHEQGLVGSIYKGRVTKVLPGMQSAFVNIGLERDAFLYVSDFFEEAEENESLAGTMEDKIEKLDSDPGEGRSQRLTPAVIEIPTILDVAPAATPAVPPVAESAVTTQPPVIPESVAAQETQVEKRNAGTPAEGGQKSRNEYDRRGRYGRRRGRRRPWERREEQRNAPAPVPAPAVVPAVPAAPPEPPAVTPSAPPVLHASVNVLTPLPGESFSKFQGIPRGENVPEEPAATIEIPSVVSEERRELDAEDPTLRLDATPVSPTVEPEDFKGESPTDVLIEPHTDSEVTSAAPTVSPVEETIETPDQDLKPASARFTTPGAYASARSPVIEEPDRTAVEVNEDAPIEVSLAPIGEAPVSPVSPESGIVAPPLEVFVVPVEETPTAEILETEITSPPPTAKTSLTEESKLTEGTVEAPLPPEVPEADESAACVETVEQESFPANEPHAIWGPPREAEEAFIQPETAPEPPSVIATPELNSFPSSEMKPVEPITEESPAVMPVETSPLAPTTDRPEVEKPAKPQGPREPHRPSFVKKDFRKARFEEKRFEGRVTPPPPAPKPEVYGPPTPYQFMTAGEKAEHNARLAAARAAARLQESSSKLSAPQTRERDYGYQRGRRGRRGRKRFGERESREEQAPTREDKRGFQRPLITDLLREGQEILVQIAKEPLGKKGARITSHIALPGRYLVYMPTVDHIGVSRKVGSDEERHRLKRIINENRAGLSGGFIVRTAGEGRAEEELKQDIRFLANTWADIRARAEKRAAPAVLHRDLGVLERILRDQLSSDFTAIRLDSETEFTKVLEFVHQFQPSLVGRVKLHLKDTPIFEEYGVDHEIEKALKPKVWLKSGGYIVINQTEAMVAIDVNTGKFVGKTTRLEDTIVKTNIDAAKEVARQIRLRDMGGIIVIDFIDMEERKNRQKVIQSLEEAMRSDRAPYKILAFNDFGLVALTRKRVKQSLEKTLLTPCAYCQGHGMIKSIQTVCYEIQAEAKKMAPLLDGKEIRIRVHPEVAKALKTSDQSVIAEIEGHSRKEVIIKTDPQIHQDQYDIF